MMEFSAFNLFVREIANGAMALSALLLIVIFARYVFRNRHGLRESGTTQVAAALLVLMCGHFIRATNLWVAFSMVAHGRDVYAWMEATWVWYIIAGCLILGGKAMMIYWFAPRRWRTLAVLIGIPACIIIPATIAIVF